MYGRFPVTDSKLDLFLLKLFCYLGIIIVIIAAIISSHQQEYRLCNKTCIEKGYDSGEANTLAFIYRYACYCVGGALNTKMKIKV